MQCRGSTHSEAAGQQGFALLLVIWVLGILTVIAVGIAVDAQRASSIARNRFELARARALAESGIALAIAGLLTPEDDARWRADGSTRWIQFDGGSIGVTVEDEGGKLDLNRAPLEFIGRLLSEFGLSSSKDRNAILARITERRLAASERIRPSVASLTNFPRRNRSAISAEAAFATVSELLTVEGVTRAAFEHIRPFITVYSQSATVNPLTAPREVLEALPGVSRQTVDLYLAARATWDDTQPSAMLPSLGAAAANYLARDELGVATIIAHATTARGASFTREAKVALAAATDGPFQILAWRERVEPVTR